MRPDAECGWVCGAWFAERVDDLRLVCLTWPISQLPLMAGMRGCVSDPSRLGEPLASGPEDLTPRTAPSTSARMVTRMARGGPETVIRPVAIVYAAPKRRSYLGTVTYEDCMALVAVTDMALAIA